MRRSASSRPTCCSNYEVKGPADRVLIYLTLYISQAINQMVNQSKGGAQKNLFNLAIQNFAVPGDKNFALAVFVSNPANRAEADQICQYLTQLRQETGDRLIEAVYAFGENEPSKWWMCFSKRKFLNKNL